MGQVIVLVGAQWGDEGKGKWIDILAKDADIVARYQGGNNAGHTIYVNGQKVVLHQIPSGIFKEGHICALSAGVVINPVELISEIAAIKGLASVTPDALWLSARAHVITPWHIHLDGKNEGETSKPIGTTKRGIGPTYTHKAARIGLRLGNYVVAEQRHEWLERMLKEESFAAFYGAHREEWASFDEAAETIAPFVCDAETKMRKAMAAGKSFLMEGAQGSLLDIDHGTYPYVTSSATTTGGAFASLGFSPKRIKDVIGVAKAYVTRVGEGPLPTELQDDAGRHLSKQGNEFGATTGRPRRCGWLDAVALRYAIAVNGCDQLILNKLDVLTGLKALKICVAYDHPTLGRLEDFPWDYRILVDCKPVYETHPGWSESISDLAQYSDLPDAAKKYVKAVEEQISCAIPYVGTGVGPKDFLEQV